MLQVTPKVSIIIPVYNVEKYLRACLDSVVAQTFTDWECILVDDGSRDSSPAICDEYAQRDHRFIALHRENGGASCARNMGLWKAHGEYVCFVDSDDVILPEYISCMVNSAECNNVDLVLQGFIIKSDTSEVAMSTNIDKQYLGVTAVSDFVQDVSIGEFCGPVSKLFKRGIIIQYGILFNEASVMAEDFDFYVRYLLHVMSISVISDCTYLYLRRDNSVSKTIHTFDKEHTSLCNIFNSICLLQERTMHCDGLQRVENGIVTYFFDRLITSIYIHKSKQCKRFNQLKLCHIKWGAIIKDCYRPSVFSYKVIRYLFVNKLFAILDFVLLMRYYKKSH